MGVDFPLLNRDRITCSTCHNPHQQGIIARVPASRGRRPLQASDAEGDRMRRMP